MAQIRDVGSIAAKWVRNAQTAGPSYAEGVNNPRRPWQASTLAAAPAFAAGVQAAISQNRFAAGVQRTSEDTQRSMAAGKGADRFGPGVASAQDKYASRFAPYAQTIASTQLPPRGPRGAAQNLQRVAAIAQALNAKRTGGGGGTR